MGNLQEELNSLPSEVAKELEKWFIEKIYKTRKVLRNEKLNYVPYVKRRQVVWVDFGINVGQELRDCHPAVVLYSNDKSGTIVIIPMTTKENESDFVIDIGSITGMDNELSHAKVDQIKSISKLRIQTKKKDGVYYNNYNKLTGEYSNPKVSTTQIQKIDDAIMLFREKSEK